MTLATVAELNAPRTHNFLSGNKHYDVHGRIKTKLGLLFLHGSLWKLRKKFKSLYSSPFTTIN